MPVPGDFYYNDTVDDDSCDEDCPCGCEGNRKQCVYSCLDAAQHGVQPTADHAEDGNNRADDQQVGRGG